MNRSQRHHYLPEFFLKEFANEEGKLFVYNKQKDIIESDPKSPKSICFEWDRNTSKLDGQEFTWIEDLYSQLDNTFSTEYKSIISRQSRITEERDMIAVGLELIMFINFIRWRVPARDSIINSLFEKNSFHDFSFHLVDQIGDKVENPAIEKFLSSFEPFVKAQSASMIFEPFNNYNHIKFVTEKLVMVGGTNNATLICDNPFIERNLTENVKEISEFFFPLSKNRLVFYL